MDFKYLLKKLKIIPGFSNVYQLVRLIYYRLVIPLQYLFFGKGFRGDKVFQKLIEKIVLSLSITNFVETGTYLGNSIKFMTGLKTNLSIMSCEIKKKFFVISKIRFLKNKNVKLYFGSSTDFLKKIINSNDLGNLPCFFLDAHWYKYWPLEDEIKIIDSFYNRAIIIIDDFEIPGRPEFCFDTFNNKACGFDLIRSLLNKESSYKALLPNYSKKDAFPKENRFSSLSGYVVIFKNLEKEFNLIAEFFSDKYITKII